MAPFFSFSRLAGRDASSDVEDKNAQVLPGLTQAMLDEMATTSLSLAIVSIVASLFAFYWFVRMRRSFRQDLIMLLIQSDMLKAFWLMLCPVVHFIRGPVRGDGVFCQVSAFFLTAAIEASDIAVLMIAVHSGLYIFRPQRSRGETGLYPYRRYAYAIWVFVPLLQSAIVPMSGARFVDNGTHCYLPAKPLWYRTALSWIPRYVIFGVIIVTYSWIYLYVWYRFRPTRGGSLGAGSRSSTCSYKSCRRRLSSRGHALTPAIADHGLLETTTPRVSSDKTRARQQSADSSINTLKLDTLPRSERGQGRSSSSTGNELASDHVPQSPVQSAGFSVPGSPATVSFAIEYPSPSYAGSIRHGSTHSRTKDATPSYTPQRQASVDNTRKTKSEQNMDVVLSVLRRGPTDPVGPEGAIASPPDLNRPIPRDTLERSRKKVRRQLRLLFVYPLVYIVTWIAPFVSQILRYDDELKPKDKTGQPFALLVASMASLSIGAAVDCCFFIAWEKPWRRLRGGFWEGLAVRLRIRKPPRRMGRTRDEQLADARMALKRRDREVAERALQKTTAARTAREWWDVDEDGTDED